MEKIIACCGLNCAGCDARIATIANDNELRKATAEKWQKLYNSPNISPDKINCTGCREEGVKLEHCYECKIRQCVQDKGYQTCGACPDMKDCAIVAPVHQFAPEAIDNLKGLN
jgi:hypothetical protein